VKIDNWIIFLFMDTDPGIEALMERYQRGDFTAAATLVNQLSPQLHRFFLVEFVSRHYADDLLQETWLRIHKVRHTYRPGQPVLPWLYAIARHIRVDHYRRVRRSAIHEQRLERNMVVPQPARTASPSAPDLQVILGTLPESQREVIAMLKVAGMTLEEAARATSSSIGSVKQKAHRAYESIRERLRDSESVRKGEPS